jgi:acyl dehydratase
MNMHSWEKLYLDDLSLGQEFESDPVRVNREAMLAFAREYDPQPFHLSAEEAESSLFGGLAASGWNTAALTMKMLVASVPLANGIIGLGIELSWPTPTYPDDVLRLFSTVKAIDPSAIDPSA